MSGIAAAVPPEFHLFGEHLFTAFVKTRQIVGRACSVKSAAPHLNVIQRKEGRRFETELESRVILVLLHQSGMSAGVSLEPGIIVAQPRTIGIFRIDRVEIFAVEVRSLVPGAVQDGRDESICFGGSRGDTVTAADFKADRIG